MKCPECVPYGVFYCRETVGICDKCGEHKDVYMDYAVSGDRERPDQTICLDCLIDGAHIDGAHR